MKYPALKNILVETNMCAYIYMFPSENIFISGNILASDNALATEAISHK